MDGGTRATNRARNQMTINPVNRIAHHLHPVILVHDLVVRPLPLLVLLVLRHRRAKERFRALRQTHRALGSLHQQEGRREVLLARDRVLDAQHQLQRSARGHRLLDSRRVEDVVAVLLDHHGVVAHGARRETRHNELGHERLEEGDDGAVLHEHRVDHEGRRAEDAAADEGSQAVGDVDGDHAAHGVTLLGSRGTRPYHHEHGERGTGVVDEGDEVARVSNHVAHGIDVVAVPITLAVTYG